MFEMLEAFKIRYKSIMYKKKIKILAQRFNNFHVGKNIWSNKRFKIISKTIILY